MPDYSFGGRRIIEIFLNKTHALLFGMLGTLLVLLIMAWLVPAPKTVATVDITRIMQHYLDRERVKNISGETLKNETRLFGRQLEKYLKVFSEKNHLVILPKEAVMAGGLDYTRQIEKAFETAISSEEDFT